MKPNKRNIRKWVKALRSGHYKQAKGHLTIKSGGERHCCLGVACVGDRVVLPRETQEWLGIDDCNPTIQGSALSSWNDDAGADFNKIADLIEREYLTA